MQFLVVRAKKNSEYIKLPVIIDGQENGITGSLIKLDEGTIDVSVKHKNALPVTIDLENTTIETPLIVDIDI